MRKASMRDLQFFVEVISNSFVSNPSVNWVIRNDKHRERRIRALAKYSFLTALRREGAYLSEQGNGIALCYRMNARSTSITDYWNQLILVFRAIGPARVFKVMKRENYANSKRPADGNYLYFWFYGVMPGKQGQGDAAELKDRIFAMADKEQLPVYLETSVEKNRRVYQRYGFEIYHTWGVVKEGINLYFMRRMPKTPQ